MAVDFSESANALVGDVLQGQMSFNNLAVGIQNGTSTTWTVDHYVNHGNVYMFAGNVHLYAVNPAGDHEKPSTFEVGLVTQGAGCNIGFVFTSSKLTKFVIIAATSPSKTGYVTLCKTTKAQASAEDYLELADSEARHDSGKGWATINADGVTVRVMTSGSRPAFAFIQLIED